MAHGNDEIGTTETQGIRKETSRAFHCCLLLSGSPFLRLLLYQLLLFLPNFIRLPFSLIFPPFLSSHSFSFMVCTVMPSGPERKVHYHDHNAVVGRFVLYAVHVVLKENRRLVLPRTFYTPGCS